MAPSPSISAANLRTSKKRVPHYQHRVFIGKQGAQRMKYEQDLIVKLNSRSRKKTATSPRLLVPPKMLREP
ncbi:hypothetical protein L596_015622 [Steinernema carpocapsae]|uniref:Uncharacterized protein n=1 Tax=Steinernema carpocapsae TaxID=34508 RepID=A0A4U5NFJ8_STECR|nr:hypothetical protein L596_015622 [Steinernema carpocapsae]